MVGVGSTTLAQHCPYVNILSLAVGSISSWNQYVGPTLGQCTPVTCFNMTRLRWVHYVGPTLDQRMPATLVFDNSLLKKLRWPNVGPMYIGDLFWYDRVALGALRWANIEPTYACHFGFLWQFVENTTLIQRRTNVLRWLVLTWLGCVWRITLGQHWTNVFLPLWFWIKVCWEYYVDPTLGQCTPANCCYMTELRWANIGPTYVCHFGLDKSLLKILQWPNVWKINIWYLF